MPDNGRVARRGRDADDELQEAAYPRGETGLELMERDMPAIFHHCEPWIPEGMGITAGRPKLGKTTLLRQKMVAVASGGELFGCRCSAARCAFLSLEENARQMRHKLELAGFPAEALGRIVFHFTWERGTNGVLQLARFLDANQDIRYVGIDSLTRFRTVPDHRTPAFMADYEAVRELQELCKQRAGLTIEVVHHTRKAKSEDPLEDISGTYGLSAACDWYGVMRHHEDGAVLHVGGRLWDREENQFQLRRGNQRWELVGEFTGMTEAQRDTLEVLRKSKGMGPTEACRFWNISKQSAQQRLESLVRLDMAYSKAGVYYSKD